MSHYFRSDEGGERSVCLAFGFLSLLVAMLVLVVREDYLEFGLEPGFASLFDNLEIFAKQHGYAYWSYVSLTKIPKYCILYKHFIINAHAQIFGKYWLVFAPTSIPVTKLTVKLGLAAFCAYIGALLAFPGLRVAQTHLDAVQMNADRPLIQ